MHLPIYMDITKDTGKLDQYYSLTLFLYSKLQAKIQSKKSVIS